MSTGHDDYTKQPYGTTTTGTAGATEWNPADYDFIPLEATPDADAIERESAERDAEFRAKYPRYRECEPGDHELVIAGFVKPPEMKLKTGWLRGQQVSWESASVGVRLAKATDRLATVTDWFDLPPRDPGQQDAYLNASKEPNSDRPGFSAGKFGHFIARIGFPFAAGAPLPREACNLGNWVGRHVHATVIPEKVKEVKINQQTGLPYPPRSQVKLFSYRAAEQTIRGQAPHAGQQAAQQGAPQRAAMTAQPARQSSPAGHPNPLAAAGLNDL